MKVNLFTSWYYDNDEILKIRKEEFDFCTQKNNSSGIDNIVVLNIGRRPMYSDFIKEFKKYPNDINIIANPDNFFEKKSIEMIVNFFNSYQKDIKKLCLGLTRWNYIDENNSWFFNAKDSQDCYIFFGEHNFDDRFEIPIGVPGCDNKFVYLLMHQYNYDVLNPSKSIKVFHYHPSDDLTRTYLNPDYSKNCFVDGPYEHLTPYKLDNE
jgi:hypothetical protein